MGELNEGVNELRPLPPEQLARAEQRLNHPVPASRIDAARKAAGSQRRGFIKAYTKWYLGT